MCLLETSDFFFSSEYLQYPRQSFLFDFTDKCSERTRTLSIEVELKLFLNVMQLKRENCEEMDTENRKCNNLTPVRLSGI